MFCPVVVIAGRDKFGILSRWQDATMISPTVKNRNFDFILLVLGLVQISDPKLAKDYHCVLRIELKISNLLTAKEREFGDY